MQILTFLLIINIFNLKSYTAKSSSKTSDVIDLKTSNPTLKLFKNANLKSDYNGNYSTDDILNYMMNYSANLNKTSKIFNVSTSEGLKNSLNKVEKFKLFSL